MPSVRISVQPRRRNLVLGRRCSLGGGRFGSAAAETAAGSGLRRNGLRAALHLGVAQGLHLGQTLLFLVHAHGDELDHRLGDAQAALDLADQAARRGDREQHIEAVVELADGVGQTAASHLLDALDLAAAGGDVGREAFDQLVQIGLLHVGTNDKHDFVSAIHSVTSFCEVLLRTVPACVLPTRSGMFDYFVRCSCS